MSKLNADAQPFVAGRSRLRANAQPFVAAEQSRRRDDDERCLYMTFSSGLPLTKEEILHHFSGLFGACVECVYVHKRHRIDPEFGKITFTTPSLPEMILGNRNVVKMWVNKKPIWLKKYVPRSRRRSMEME